MANTDIPNWGIQPLFMSEARKTALLLPITNNYGTALFHTDPVVAVTAGTIERGPTNSAWLGVILELFKRTGTGLYSATGLVPVQYMAASPGASDTYFALVAVDPMIFYSMQEDGDGSSLQITDMWGACDIVFGSGNTTTGLSGAEIDSSSADNTATRPIMVVAPFANYFDIDAGAYNAISTDGAAGNYCKFIVKQFNGQMGPGAVTAALA